MTKYEPFAPAIIESLLSNHSFFISTSLIKKQKNMNILLWILPKPFDSEYIHFLIIRLLYSLIGMFLRCIAKNVNGVALSQLQFAAQQCDELFLPFFFFLALQRNFQIDLPRLTSLAEIGFRARVRFHAVTVLPNETTLALDHQAFIPDKFNKKHINFLCKIKTKTFGKNAARFAKRSIYNVRKNLTTIYKNVVRP